MSLYIKHIHNYTLKSLKSSYHCGLKLSKRIWKMHQPYLFLLYFCKKKHMQEGVWLLYISFQNHNMQAGTGKFMYKAMIINEKQLLLKHNDYKAIKVLSTTRNAFLTDILLKLPSRSCYLLL